MKHCIEQDDSEIIVMSTINVVLEVGSGCTPCLPRSDSRTPEVRRAMPKRDQKQMADAYNPSYPLSRPSELQIVDRKGTGQRMKWPQSLEAAYICGHMVAERSGRGAFMDSR